MESRLQALGSIGLAGSVVALGVWATVFEGWRTDFIYSTIVNTPSGDKIGHVLLYGLLALAIGIAAEVVAPKVAWLLGPWTAWMLGLADELRQAGIRGRDTSLADLMANTVGVAMVLIFLAFRAWKRQRRRTNGSLNSYSSSMTPL